MKSKELEETVARLLLQVRDLEERLDKLEKGSFGTGVYVDGCNDLVKSYITSEKPKEGE